MGSYSKRRNRLFLPELQPDFCFASCRHSKLNFTVLVVKQTSGSLPVTDSQHRYSLSLLFSLHALVSKKPEEQPVFNSSLCHLAISDEIAAKEESCCSGEALFCRRPCRDALYSPECTGTCLLLSYATWSHQPSTEAYQNKPVVQNTCTIEC